MGSNQFQREYIEYLEKCNTELLNRINKMQESYENRILSKDLNKEYLISTLEDVLNIFTVIPQEIDMFFDQITATVAAFRTILLRKSEMVRLREKFLKALNVSENCDKLTQIDDPVLMKDDYPDSRGNKKVGPIKVSPMINGHIISTDPRICLSRMPRVFPSGRQNETNQLSPIIEASPDTSPEMSNLGSHVLKEIKIPLERININKIRYNYMSEESPKTRFKGPKLWKKSLSSNKRQSDYQRKSIFSENSENSNKKISVGDTSIPGKSESVDPLEGPSWLYEENNDLNSSSNRFINYRRRKHRFATVFDKDEDCFAYAEKIQNNSLKQDDKEFFENHTEAKDDEGNFDDIKERLSESSEDFISTSNSSDGSENYSPSVKRRQKKRRGRTKQPSDEKVATEFDSELKKENSRVKSENRKTRSVCSDSSDEEEIERKKFIPRSSKNRKSSRKRSMSSRGKLSFEKTPTRFESVEREIRKSKKSRDSKRKNTSLKDEQENVECDHLDDRLDAEKMLPKRSRTGGEKKSERSKSKSKSRSPATVLTEEGRPKRKAAPMTLKEASLISKLRRSK